MYIGRLALNVSGLKFQVFFRVFRVLQVEKFCAFCGQFFGLTEVSYSGLNSVSLVPICGCPSIFHFRVVDVVRSRTCRNFCAF